MRCGRDITRGGRQRGRRAFTLVEVLASLVLVAIILPVAMKGVSLCLELSETARQQMEAGALAELRLAEVLATEEWTDGDASGDFGEDRPRYTWNMTVEEWEGPSISQIDVSVEWTSRGKTREVTLSTLAYTGEPIE